MTAAEVRELLASEAAVPTMRGLRACAAWLAYCVRIGWPKSSLDRLEEIWWQHHDRNGRLFP